MTILSNIKILSSIRYEIIIFPNTPNHLPPLTIKYSFPFNCVTNEITREHLPITQNNLSPPLLWIIPEFTLITHPTIPQLCEILILKRASHWTRAIIIEFPHTIKFIIIPLPFISYFSVFIEELSIAAHFIIFPLALIMTAILKVQGSMAIFELIEDIALISASFLKEKADKLWEMWIFFKIAFFSVNSLVLLKNISLGSSWTRFSPIILLGSLRGCFLGNPHINHSLKTIIF